MQGKPQKIACPPGNHGLGKVSRSAVGLPQALRRRCIISARVCVQRCRSKGLVAGQLANGVDAPSGQSSPGIYLAQHMRQGQDGNVLGTRARDVHLLGCVPSQTDSCPERVSRRYLHDFLVFLDKVGVRSVDTAIPYLDRRRGERDDLSDAVPEHENVPVGIRRATVMDIPLTTLKY